MKSNEQERLLRYILKWEPRTAKEIEASNNFRQYIYKRRKKIQLLQGQSVSNQLYIFPRGKAISNSSSSISDNLDNLNDQPLHYCLPQQNKRNKSYQHSSQIYFKTMASVAEKQTGREGKGKGALNMSLQRNEFQHSQNKVKMAKEDTPNRHLSKKRKKQQEKTVINSSKKLIVAEQYSLGAHPNQAHTKKGSENATISCRTKPPKLRSKTET